MSSIFLIAASTNALGWIVSRLPLGIWSTSFVSWGTTVTILDPRSTRRILSSNGWALPSDRLANSAINTFLSCDWLGRHMMNIHKLRTISNLILIIDYHPMSTIWNTITNWMQDNTYSLIAIMVITWINHWVIYFAKIFDHMLTINIEFNSFFQMIQATVYEFQKDWKTDNPSTFLIR